MKKFFLKIGLLFLLFIPTFCFSLEVPDLNLYVNDFADILSVSQENEIEASLKNFNDTTSNQIVIMTINSLEDEALEGYSLKIAEKNKIGQKNKDNGILFLIVKDDRVMRIEVGYGLEGYVTDAKSNYIIRNVINPEFQNENYYQGIKDGVSEIMKLTNDAGYLNDKIANEREIPIVIQIIFFILFIIIIIKNPWLLLFMLGGRGNRSSRGGGFGGFSGGGGSFGGGGNSGRW